MALSLRAPGVVAGVVASVVAMTGGGAVLADEPRVSPLRKPAAVSIQAWGKSHSHCAEWTNACAVCTRIATNEIACSTPGIACQPKAIVCNRQAVK